MAESGEVDRPPLKQLKGVRYIGTSNVRLMTIEDWERAGVTGVEESTVWNADNDHFVAIGQMNAAAVDLLATQDDFELVDA